MMEPCFQCHLPLPTTSHPPLPLHLFQTYPPHPPPKKRPRPRPPSITCKKPVKYLRPDKNPLVRTHSPFTPHKLGFTEIGIILGPHGVRGEVKVLYTSDFPKQRLTSKSNNVQRYVLLGGRRYPRRIEIIGGRKASQRGLWIMGIVGVGDVGGVGVYKGARLFVRDGCRPRGLGGGEFMVGELVGLKVFEEGGGNVGWVCGVVLREDVGRVTGGDASVGNDVLEIECGDGMEGDGDKEMEKFLMPFVRDLVVEVDLKERKIVICPPEGLMEITRVRKQKQRFLPRGLLCAAK